MKISFLLKSLIQGVFGDYRQKLTEAKVKKISSMAFLLFFITLSGFSMVSAGNAMAHSFWLNATDFLPDYSEKFGAKSIIYMGYGHHYPVHDFLQPDDLESYEHIMPGGEKNNLTSGNSGYLETSVKLPKPGLHIIAASLKPGFYTMSEENGRIKHSMEPKTGLKNVVKSVYHHRFAKALLVAGDSSGDGYKQVLGQKIEIIPQSDPTTLKTGDMLSIQVLLDGNPAKYFNVNATYAGFSSKDDYAFYTKTDSKGMAQVRIIHYGPWLIRVDDYIKAKDDMAEKCDFMHYTATLTFEVR